MSGLSLDEHLFPVFDLYSRQDSLSNHSLHLMHISYDVLSHICLIILSFLINYHIPCHD